ncbi:hypothetical protein VTN77DRAFT_4482 [Rasamsonia byssochlamydoides]|uniref:uncharacterized protein n=1 Tax=Rasamsonia byssochlamydoides TaxID=89139 RepID=UPI00374221DA
MGSKRKRKGTRLPLVSYNHHHHQQQSKSENETTAEVTTSERRDEQPTTTTTTSEGWVRFFHSSKFSDLVIQTDDQEFHVHRIVVCGQSEVFAGMLNNDCLETTTNTIKLQDDDPRAVEAMLHFLYGFEYDHYDNYDSEKYAGCVSFSPMLFHVKVYQVADKYGVAALKRRAREEFAAAVQTGWETKKETEDFAQAIIDAYAVTAANNDRGLRDPIVEVAHKHIDELLKKDGFVHALEEAVGFATDLIRALPGGYSS